MKQHKSTIYALARPEIVAMKPYSSARSEAPAEGILLNANESPWPLTSADADESNTLSTQINRYPEPQPQRLISRLAKLYAVDPSQLLVTRGSDEGIDLLTRVFCRAGKDSILQNTPAFGMYRIAALTQGASIVSIPRLAKAGLRMDADQLFKTLNENNQIKLVFLTTPNNPTGDSINKTFLVDLLEATRDKAIIVVDEAYAEFSSEPSFTPLVSEYENLVILRTLSKAWAGAGLRCGSMIADPIVIDLMGRIMAPYPLASPVVELAERLLTPEMLKQQQRLLENIQINKQRLLSILEKKDYISDIWPGDANFILLRTTDAEGLMQHCARRKVILRAFKNEPLLQQCIRITVGSDSDLDALEAALDAWENT